MKETVLDVLMYLFEHYFDDDTELDSDRESLKQELVEAGFPEGEIGKAFEWLEALTPEDAAAAPLEGDALPAWVTYLAPGTAASSSSSQLSTTLTWSGARWMSGVAK